MAKREARLSVVYTALARTDLIGIWEWNATQYGVARADAYVAFLDDQISLISKSPDVGLEVSEFPGVRRYLAKKQSRGHGHIIFYETSEHELRIITILHTAQDWLSRFRPD